MMLMCLRPSRALAFLPLRLLLLLVVPTALTGCGGEAPSIAVYQAPADLPPPPPAPRPVTEPGHGHHHHDHSHDGHEHGHDHGFSTEPVAFDIGLARGVIPAGWQREANPGAMVLLRIRVDPNDPSAQLTLSRFPGDVGGELANINRWREQVGLPPVDDPASQDRLELREMNKPGRVYHFVRDAADPASPRSIIASLPDPNEDATWFVRMIGTNAMLDRQVTPFILFLAQLQLGAEQATSSQESASQSPNQAYGTPSINPSAPNPSASAPDATGAPTFDLGIARGVIPTGWQRDPNPGAMVLMRLRVDPAEPAAQLTLSRFPGDVGGELANINRWRGQVGLPPVSDPAEQQRLDVPDLNKPGQVYDFQRDPSDPASPRSIVASLPDPREDATWFVRVAGPSAVLERQVPALVLFLTLLQLSPENASSSGAHAPSPEPRAQPVVFPASAATHHTAHCCPPLPVTATPAVAATEENATPENAS